jgi:hypothetical protein
MRLPHASVLAIIRAEALPVLMEMAPCLTDLLIETSQSAHHPAQTAYTIARLDASMALIVAYSPFECLRQNVHPPATPFIFDTVLLPSHLRSTSFLQYQSND